MSNGNPDDLRGRKLKFIFLYACTVILIIVVGSAFFILPPTESRTPIAAIESYTPLASDKTISSSTEDINNFKLQLDSLNLLVIQKDEKIKQLEGQLNIAKRSINKEGEKNKDENFYKWALSSQSKEVKQLKSENAKLKEQISDLRKFLK